MQKHNSYDMFEDTKCRKQQTIVNTMAKEKGHNDKHWSTKHYTEN